MRPTRSRYKQRDSYCYRNNYTRTYTYDLNGNMIGRNYAQHSERWAQDAGNAPLSWTGSEPPPPSPTPTLLAVPPPVEEDEVEGYAYDADGNRTAVTVAQGDTLSVMQYNLINLPSKYANAQGDTVR